MRILLLCHGFNSLSQRLYAELALRDHELSVELDISDEVTLEAVERFRPELVIAPYLKRAIPESVWRRYRCLIVHPGPPGDRGPSALDWAVLKGEKTWGVTVLQAEAEMDAGPVWAWREFAMRNARKSALYRLEATETAVAAVLEAVAHAGEEGFSPAPAADIPGAGRHGWQPSMNPSARRIDWESDTTATVLRKIHCADGSPGVEATVLGIACRLFDARPAPGWRGEAGQVIGCHGEAVCLATTDGAVWIGRLRGPGDGAPPFKLPATQVLGERRLAGVPRLGGDITAVSAEGYADIRYEEDGPVGLLHFDFYNGAMSTARCRRLLAAYRQARARPTRVIVLAGGAEFWSNGLDLNAIEAAASPADESWRNIVAMDDLAREIITTTDKLTVSALQGNAGAGGVFLALAADEIHARRGIVFNPHYQNMGNLYGSEYWTYLLPRRLGHKTAAALMQHRLPVLADTTRSWGLVDAVGDPDPATFLAAVRERAHQLADAGDFARRIRRKREERNRDETLRPLAQYRDEELEHMKLNFYGFDPSYHVARYKFVHRVPHAWTPLYLARHRRLGWQGPGSGWPPP